MSRGVGYILATIILFAGLHFGLSWNDLSMRAMITTFIGGSAFILMAWAIVLAARPGWLETAFGGLDRMYQIHKFIGVNILLLMLVHFIGIPKLDAAQRLPAEGLSAATGVPGGIVGMITMILLILSVVISLNRKIPYHIWIKPHRLMGVLFACVAFHMFLSPPQIFNGKSASGMFLTLIAAIGIFAYLYRQIARNRKAVSYKLEVVNKLSRATEIVLAPSSDAKIEFSSGQFGFLTLDQKGMEEPHPFTISSAPSDNNVRFTVKVLGDFTRKVRDELKAGISAKIEGPYGRFNMDAGGDHQVWVAGGVGITPFLSAMRAMADDDSRNITLFYCVQERDQALFLEEFEAKFSDHKSRKLIILESNNKEFATVDLIKETAAYDITQPDYYLCGPKPMIDGLKSALKKEGTSKDKIHFEAFEFR